MDKEITLFYYGQEDAYGSRSSLLSVRILACLLVLELGSDLVCHGTHGTGA